MELRQYWEIYWKWLWLLVLGTVLAALAAFLASQAMPPVYRSSTTLLVNQLAGPVVLDTYTAVLTSERLTKTYAELVRKRPVLDRVNQSLGLPYTAERLATMIEVQLVRDTQLLVVAVEHTDPYLARDIANRLAEVFIGQNAALYADRVSDVRQKVDQQLANLERDIKSTSEAIENLRSSQTPSETGRAELSRLQASLAQYQLTYSSLIKDREEARLNEARLMTVVTVAEPAEVPLSPVRPRILLNVLVAAVVGLLLTLGVVLLLEYLDDTVKTSDDVARAAGMVTLGAIRRFEPTETRDNRLLVSDNARSPISEAYRVLRTNIQFSSINRPLHTLLVTSPNPMEGKTTTAANLALVMAQAGKQVILVDSDLRRPALHRFFGLSNTAGLTNLLLSESSDGQNLLQATKVKGLRLLASGPLPPNPSELLGSARMRSVVDGLREKAEVLIFDSPPALSVTDPAVLAAHLDGVLLVVDAGRTRAEVLRRAKEALERTASNIIGVALNKLSLAGSGYYHYYYYYYGQGDGRRRRRSRRPSLLQRGQAALGRLLGSTRGTAA